ncbi:MAG: cell division protein SepF [Bacillota bacterium]
MSLMEKVRGALNWGIDDEYEEHDEISEREERAEKFDRADRLERIRASASFGREERSEKPTKKSKKKFFGDSDKKIVHLNYEDEVRVASLRLMTFEDARKVDMHLKFDRTVIADLANLEKEEAQRALDFICGIVEALEANIQRSPNTSLFIITPCGTGIVGDTNDEFKYKGVFPWVK